MKKDMVNYIAVVFPLGEEDIISFPVTDSYHESAKHLLNWCIDRDVWLCKEYYEDYYEDKNEFYDLYDITLVWQNFESRMNNCNFDTFQNEFREEIVNEIGYLDRIPDYMYKWKIILIDRN